MTMSYASWKTLHSELEKQNQTLVPVTRNLVDLIWDNQPKETNNIVFPLELRYTGK